MKLEINLADREEIAAAVPLLQVILANTHAPHACSGSGQCQREPEVRVGVGGTLDLTGTQAEGLVGIADPAVVFGGGAQPAAPLAVASSIAGASPLSIAPEAMTATTSTATPSAPVPPVPTAPATVAPTASAAAPVTPASGVELDKNGLPWDERIHAGTKTKIKSGEWKAKKGVEAALVAQVEAELRARMAAAPVAAVPAAPAVADPAAVFGAAAPGVPPAPAIPTAPPVAALAPAVPAAPSAVADPTTFEQLMPRITAGVTAGILPATAVGQACAAHGVASVVTLQQQPAFVPLVWATLKATYPALA